MYNVVLVSAVEQSESVIYIHTSTLFFFFRDLPVAQMGICVQCRRPEFDPWGGKGEGNPLQYSCLENPMDRGAWQTTVYGVTKSWTQLRD